MSILKKTSIVIIILFFVQLSFANEINDKIGFKFNQILYDLDSIIKNSMNQNEIVNQRYKFVIEKIYKNEINIAYDSTFFYGFYGCAATKILVDTNSVELTIGDFIIDIYDKHPFIVHSVLIFQFQLIFEFYNNRDAFLISIDNSIENLYYNIDALLVEAMFIKDYLSELNNLAPLEKYLKFDLDYNMTGASKLFYNTDLTLLHRLDELRNKKNIKKALKEYNSIGEELMQNVKFDGSNWENYYNLVSLNTYVYYSSQILHDINFKLVDKTDEFNLNNYPDTKDIIKKVKDYANDNIDWFNYQDETLKKFNNYYLN